MPKILIVTTVPETVKAFLLPQIKQLKQSGWEVYVATGQCGCQLPELAEMGVPEHRIPLMRSISPLKDIQAIFAVIKLCRRHRFDLIHTHTLKASLIGQTGARLAGVPVRIETAHGTVHIATDPFLRRMSILMLEKMAAWNTHRVWVLNTEDLELFKRYNIGKQNAVELLGKGGIGLDIDHYSPHITEDQQAQNCRQSLGLPSDVPVVGFVGRLVKDKGINELYQAWSQLNTQHPSACLLIVSAVLPSERKNEVFSASKLKNLNNCFLLTNRSDMNKLYRCMDMLVLPSYREGFSRVIMEAMASGVPVITTDVKGCRDAVKDGQTGLLIPCKDVDSLKKAMCQLISDIKLRCALSANARQWAIDNFDQKKINTHILKTYEKLLKTKGYYTNDK